MTDRIRVVASISRTQRRDKLFPKGTPAKVMREWKAAAVTALHEEAKAKPAGSLLDELERVYLPIKKQIGMPTYAQRETDLRRMIAILGPSRTRLEIEPVDVLAMAAQLKAAGRARRTREGKAGRQVKAGGRVVKELSNRTVNLLLFALQNFFTALGGKRGHNPVKDIEKFPEAADAAEPPPITLDLFDRILAAMPDLGRIAKGKDRSAVSLTKLRLAVIAYAGLPQITIGRITATDIDWAAGTVTVAGRKKGRGTTRKKLQIPEHGMGALRALVDADGLGPFSPSSMWQSFKRAAVRVAPGLKLSPYSLRHLYATVTLDASEDLEATRRLMDHGEHGSKSTTLIYTRAARAAMNRRANVLFDRAVDAARGIVVPIGSARAARARRKTAVNG